MILEPIRHLALVAAHCDDIAIGAGATVRMLCQANPGMRVTALVLTGAGTVREDEERAALAELCAGAALEVGIAGFPDNRLPGSWAEAKNAVMALREAGDPDLVIGPQLGDMHQDHRLVAELTAQLFRSQPVWGYEIAKYESDLPATSTFVPVPESAARAKIDVIPPLPQPGGSPMVRRRGVHRAHAAARRPVPSAVRRGVRRTNHRCEDWST